MTSKPLLPDFRDEEVTDRKLNIFGVPVSHDPVKHPSRKTYSKTTKKNRKKNKRARMSRRNNR